MSQKPNKPVLVVGKSKELLQFFDAYKGRPVLHRLCFLLIDPTFPEPTIHTRYFTSSLPNIQFFTLTYSFCSLSHYSTDHKYSVKIAHDYLARKSLNVDQQKLSQCKKYPLYP